MKLLKKFTTAICLLAIFGLFATLSSPAQADNLDSDNWSQGKAKKPKPEPTPTPKPGPRDGGADD